MLPHVGNVLRLCWCFASEKKLSSVFGCGDNHIALAVSTSATLADSSRLNEPCCTANSCWKAVGSCVAANTFGLGDVTWAPPLSHTLFAEFLAFFNVHVSICFRKDEFLFAVVIKVVLRLLVL